MKPMSKLSQTAYFIIRTPHHRFRGHHPRIRPQNKPDAVWNATPALAGNIEKSTRYFRQHNRLRRIFNYNRHWCFVLRSYLNEGTGCTVTTSPASTSTVTIGHSVTLAEWSGSWSRFSWSVRVGRASASSMRLGRSSRSILRLEPDVRIAYFTWTWQFLQWFVSELSFFGWQGRWGKRYGGWDAHSF